MRVMIEAVMLLTGMFTQVKKKKKALHLSFPVIHLLFRG